MKTISSGVATEAAATQSGWAELYDIYLPSAISTPWGTISTLRLTPCPTGISFFTPTAAPEPSGTQGDAQEYSFWNLVRKPIKSQSKTANDKLAIAAGNVSREWSGMLAAVSWYDAWVVIRKVPISMAGKTAADCVTLFCGQIDSMRFEEKQVQPTASNDMGSFTKTLPAEAMHATCRFRWADDMCTAIRYLGENYAAKTAKAGGTTRAVLSDDLTEDTGAPGYIAEAVTCDAATDKVTLAGHGLANGMLVRFTAGTIPGGLTAGAWYYVVGSATDDFQVSLTAGGSAIDLTSAGVAVLMDSTAGYGTDLVAALADGSITSSSNQGGSEAYRVKAGAGSTEVWKMSDNASNPTPGIDIYHPYLEFDFGTAKEIYMAAISANSATRYLSLQYSADGTTWGTVNIQTMTQETNKGYNTGRLIGYAASRFSARYWRVVCSKYGNTPFVDGENVLVTLSLYTYTAPTTDLVAATADGDISASDEVTGHEGYRVKTTSAVGWQINAPEEGEWGTLDWGNNYQGYWQIPDDQAGLANAALKPWIQFDFGTDRTMRLWRLRTLAGVERSDMPRLLLLFSSSAADFSTCTFEGYFEIPATPPGTMWDWLVPKASTARYWRICVRSTWADALSYTMLCKVSAYEGSRGWWACGRITFDAATATSALRGVSRKVEQSFAGAVMVSDLPAVPAAGDTFIIERGCARTFNACCERRNQENFGGFDSLPFMTIVR